MDRDDVSPGRTPSVSAATSTAAAVLAVAPTSLSRSVSQQSVASSRSHRSRRNASRRGSSRVRVGLPGTVTATTTTTTTTISSSASIASDDNKSLTSFPSFSPELPPPGTASTATTATATATATRPRLPANQPSSSTTSLVESLLSSVQPATAPATIASTTTTATTSTMSTTSTAASAADAARSALFDDTPPLPSSRVLPGALHLADDAHLVRLISKHGAVALVRQLAEDLAARDAQATALRARAADRERFLRRLLQECGNLTSLDVETRLRAMEQEQEARLQSQAAQAAANHQARPLPAHRVSDLVSDAMADDNSLGVYSATSDGEDGTDPFALYSGSTVRAGSSSSSTTAATSSVNTAGTVGTSKGWKTYLWGGTTKKSGEVATTSLQPNGPTSQATVVRARVPPGTERRTVLAEDVFRPPVATEAEAAATATASSRKQSLASMALRLVGAGGSSSSLNNSASDGASASGASSTLRGRAATASHSARSSRAATLQNGGIKGGPRGLMTMRRTTSAMSVRGGASAPQHIPGATGQVPERWGEMSEASPSGTGGDGFAQAETYGPVEMDTILPLEVQPPTLTHMYNRYNSAGYLIDRFGFIYDQRRKRRQREAAAVARQMKRRHRRSETLSMGRPGRSTPSSLPIPGEEEDEEGADADADSKSSIAGSGGGSGSGGDGGEGDEGRPPSPTPAEAEAPPKRWQDYLKIATFPTELLSHTPAMSDTHLQVITDDDDGISETGETNETHGPVEIGEASLKSPGLITADGRGLVPSTTTTTTSTTTVLTSGLDTDSIVSGTTEATMDSARPAGATPTALVKEDVEPVRLLLQQLSELHDTLQKERTVRWNEFLRKVRAERRREGEAAASAAAAAAEARFLRAAAVMPETRLADGEIVGVAGLGNKGKLGRAKWNEFRALVLGGIPVALRAKIWAECTGATSLRVPGAYEALVAAGEGGADADAGGVDCDIVVQIEADIHRTLTDNIFFRAGPGAAKLRAVLLAYARRNREVGYCQGMNLIAANLLLVTPSAADAFWLLASIVETLLPAGYYDHSLAASRADQQVLRGFVAEVLPRLSGHLDALAIDLETMTFPWFLSVFTDCLSAEALFRVWDVVFCLGDGSAFMFSVALALLKLNEAALLRCDSPAAVYTYINHQMTNHAISIDGLVQASEALRRLVRRDDVDARRARAMAADRVLAAERAAALAAAQAARRRRREEESRGGEEVFHEELHEELHEEEPQEEAPPAPSPEST